MICVLISMFDEEWTVTESIKNIRSVLPYAYVHVVQSESEAKPKGQDKLTVVPNLAGTVPPHELPSHSLCRNFSLLFKETITESDYIVALTGDTLVTDATNFNRRYKDMQRTGKVLVCSQALGQDFHAANSDPANGRCGGRFQFAGISDFMPQFWMVEGGFFGVTEAFKEIAITNPYTSEQCLGDEFMRHVKGPFRNNALVVSDNAYQYKDGIKFHVKGKP